MSSSLNNCKRPHQIEVEQLKDADRVEHSLLLVKGRLLPHCGNASELQATLTKRDKEPHEQRTQLSAGAGEFKLLLQLAPSGQEEQEEEDCQLLLRCCNAERLLRFGYRPRRSVYRVQPLYLLCRSSEQDDDDEEEEQEEEEQEQASQRCAQIDLNLRLVQCIYAHKLHAAGHPNRTFSLHSPCRIFRSQLSCTQARTLGENALWQHFASEIISSPQWAEQLQLKFVAFVGCTRYDGAAVKASGDYSYANIRRHLHAHAALGGGGLALFGTGHFYAWPRHFDEIGDCIRSTRRVDVASQPDESNYRRTYGGVYASTLGAVCHELGHCFDLGHTLDGVMGRGFDYLNRVLTVDQPTEHLPQRIVSNVAANVSTAAGAQRSRPRFTPLKLKQSAGNQFLDNYHAQRLNDSFYFADNCAIILGQHRWLRPDKDTLAKSNLELDIHLLTSSREIVSNVPLRLIELRCNLNSLVAHYEVFQVAPATHRWQLPEAQWQLLATQRTHYAFVLTLAGDTKRLSWDSAV